MFALQEMVVCDIRIYDSLLVLVVLEQNAVYSVIFDTVQMFSVGLLLEYVDAVGLQQQPAYQIMIILGLLLL